MSVSCRTDEGRRHRGVYERIASGQSLRVTIADFYQFDDGTVGLEICVEVLE